MSSTPRLDRRDKNTARDAGPQAAHRVGAALDVGTVWANCFFVRDLRAPFGGAKRGWSTPEPDEQGFTVDGRARTASLN